MTSELVEEAKLLGATESIPLDDGLDQSGDGDAPEFEATISFGTDSAGVGSGIRGVFRETFIWGDPESPRYDEDGQLIRQPVSHLFTLENWTQGLMVAIKDDPKSQEFRLEAPRIGMLVCVWGSNQLDRAMTKYPQGATVAITYGGKIPHPKRRGQSIKVFATRSNAVFTGKVTREGLPEVRSSKQLPFPAYAG